MKQNLTNVFSQLTITLDWYAKKNIRFKTTFDLCSLQVISGLIADARRVVNQARDEAAHYRFTYSQPIPLKVSERKLSIHGPSFRVLSLVL